MVERSRKKKLLFFAAMLGVCLIAIEISLQILAYVSPQVAATLASPWEPVATTPPTIPDARLGHRPNPAYSGHDEKGFRNDHVAQRADIVTLGDSQTYGVGVDAEHCWPKVLESLEGKKVYNMAFGGYGPAHSLVLWDEAAKMEPRIVIEGFYAGNDLYDSFKLAYDFQQLQELKSKDKSVVDGVVRSEKEDSLAEQAKRAFAMGQSAPEEIRNRTRAAAKSSSDSPVWSRLMAQSGLYRLLRRVRYEVTHLPNRLREPRFPDEWDRLAHFAKLNSEYCYAFSQGDAKTLFTPEYRLLGMNLDDPRIREGESISLQAIAQMEAKAKRAGIHLLVVLIPTKELVYSKLATEVDRSDYRRLVDFETQFWRNVKQFLDERDIGYVDALGPLQEQLDAGPQPYRMDIDGHPNELGQYAIARAVYAHLHSAGSDEQPSVAENAQREEISESEK